MADEQTQLGTKVDKKGPERTPESKIGHDEKPYTHGPLIVSAKKDYFRRAGIVFSGNEETNIPANTLSRERYEAIRTEKMLVCVELDVDDKVKAKK